jgi:hypothetical protein
MRFAIVAVIVAGCGTPAIVSPAQIDQRVTAPPGAAWTSAELSIDTDHSHQEPSHDFYFAGSHDYEMAAAIVYVQAPTGAHAVVLDSVFGYADADAKALARRAYRLAASPDGAWIGVSTDAGKTWRLVEPTTGMTCRHLVLRGDASAIWATAPTPERLALELLHALGGKTRGPLGLDHREMPLSAWPAHAPAWELDAAMQFALEHEDAALDRSLAAALLAIDEHDALWGQSISRLRDRARTDPDVRAALLANVGANAIEALWDSPDLDLQAALVAWLERTLPVEAAAHERTWDFAHGVWDLARLVRRDHHASPAAERVAAAILTMVGEHRHRREHDYDGPDDPWAFLASSADEASAAYAIQVLAAAHTPTAKQVIDAADWNRKAPIESPPIEHSYLADYRAYELDGWTVPAWFHWASTMLADVP